MTFLIVPCGAEKREHAAPARELYTSSTFRMALRAALAQAEEGDTVLVLSARHGFVDLDAPVEPYNTRMGDPESISPEALRAQAIARGLGEADVYAFLPSAYFTRLDAALKPIGVYAQDCYEACRGIGEHRKVCRISADTTDFSAHQAR